MTWALFLHNSGAKRDPAILARARQKRYQAKPEVKTHRREKERERRKDPSRRELRNAEAKARYHKMKATDPMWYAALLKKINDRRRKLAAIRKEMKAKRGA